MSSLKGLAGIWMKEDSSQIKGTQQCVQWRFPETLRVAVRLGAKQRALVLKRHEMYGCVQVLSCRCGMSQQN